MAHSVLKDPRYRGFDLKYHLRWSIGHWLCQRDWYVDTYFDIPVHEHVAMISAIERYIRSSWQEKSADTKKKNKKRQLIQADKEKQFSMRF